MGNIYSPTPIVQKGELPDLFAWPDGTRVQSPADWTARAEAWRELIVALAYGGLPPPPQNMKVETLCHATLGEWPGKPRFWSYRLVCAGSHKAVAFTVQILFPADSGPHPAIINGDGCWWNLTKEVAGQLLHRHCALVMFNRTELAEDLGYDEVPDRQRRQDGLYAAFPEHKFGAISAWAWGYHRCVDLLQTLPFIDGERIAVSGHSRGGKATLLAGATDERIALINDNASGAGGSAPFRYVGHGGETLDIINFFPSWFGPEMHVFRGREDALPFDQHCLLALIAPRPLLLTYALDDRWSNPEGMVHCTWAAGEVYRFLKKPRSLAFHLRCGEHTHGKEDWQVILDFIGWQWLGKTPTAAYNQHPYTHLRPAFSWGAPSSRAAGR